MAKMTLLEMVQSILSSMDSDYVNSISDTEEALQVVDIIQDTYYYLMSQNDWQHLRTTTLLESLSDTNRPTHLGIPSDVSRIETIRYDVTATGDANKTYKKLKYYSPEDFIDKVLSRSSGNAEVDIVTLSSGTEILIFNDRFPTFWTSFDDETVVADAYDSTEQSTLTGNRASAICYRTTVFDNTDDNFTPDVSDEMFPLLLASARRACMIHLKQTDSPIDAKRELAGIHRMRQNGTKTNDGKRKARFGRK